MQLRLRKAAVLLLLLGASSGLLPARGAGKDTIQDPLEAKRKKGEQAATVTHAPPPPEKRVRFVELWRVPLGSPLSGPLLPLPDQVVASVEAGTVEAVSLADGHPLWKTDLSDKLATGPVAVQGIVVQATLSGRVEALDAAQGARRWAVELQQEVRRQPTSTPDGVLVPLAPGGLVLLDAEGRERWRVNLRGAPSVPVTACHGMVLAGTEAGTVEAFERTSGRRLWTTETGSAVRSPLLCYRGRIYFGTDDNRLRVLRYSGRRKWTYKVGGLITASPFPLGTRIYFPCYDNYFYALKAISGDLLLRVRLTHRLSDNALPGPERVYLSPYTSARLLALTLPELQIVGEYGLDLEGEWFTTPPVRAGDRLLIGYGRYEGRILALREEKGSAPPAAPPPPPSP